MPDTKVSALTDGTTANSTDRLPAARTTDGGITWSNVYVTPGYIKTAVIGAGSVSIASGKTFTASNTLTLAGTDSTTMTFPSTSATLARTDAGNTFTGAQTFSVGTVNGTGLDISQTWTGTGTYTGLKYNVGTDSGPSNAASLLLDLQVGGASKLNVTKSGAVTASGSYLFPSDNNYDFGSFTNRANTVWVASKIYMGTNCYFSWFDTAFISRPASATLQLGAADAAAPVAQTFKVQGVVSGTSNTAGANFTIQGSQGTGTGAGGSIIFQVAPAGSSGTAQNAYSTALTIAGNKSATFTGDLLYIGGSTHLFRDLTSSSPKFQNGSVGVTILLGNTSGGNQTGLWVTSNGTEGIGFLSGNYNNAADVILTRDAANTLALRNGTNAQTFNVYGSYTSATNYQRAVVKTLRESSGALSGATYVSTIAIPAYAVLIGVTTRVTTAVTGATSYDVGDGTDADLWGAAIGVTLGSQSRTADFTDVAATGAAATSRTVTLTANGSNFTGGVVEICLHYLTTEAD